MDTQEFFYVESGTMTKNILCPLFPILDIISINVNMYWTLYKLGALGICDTILVTSSKVDYYNLHFTLKVWEA